MDMREVVQRHEEHLVRRLEHPRRVWVVLLLAGILVTLNVVSAVAALLSA
jgi:hypothetical protein